MASRSPVTTIEGDAQSDKEKYPYQGRTAEHDIVDVDATVKEKEPDEFYISRFGFLGPFLGKLFSSGVEARGVERVPEDQREKTHLWNK